MIVEIKIKPSKEIQESEEWFPIYDTGKMIALCGDNAYARVLNEKEYILVEPTTADEFNDNHMGKYLDIDRTDKDHGPPYSMAHPDYRTREKERRQNSDVYLFGKRKGGDRRE